MKIVNGKYKEYRLNNGLVVALQNTPTRTISGRLRVNIGSYHEKEGEEGLAHLLEHCVVMGGSKKYTPQQGDEIVDSLGYTNASTGIDKTFFKGEMLNEDVSIWLDYISDHVFNPRLDLKRVNGEKERVLREISDEKSHYSYLIEKELAKTFYRGHPLEKEILGKEEVVKNASLEKMLEFHSRGYHPNNMELILVGGLPGNIDEIIENYFGKYKKGKETRVKFPKLKPLEGVRKLHFSAPSLINHDNPEQSSAILLLNYAGPIGEGIDVYSTIAMSHFLGGDTSSYLHKELGLKRGLAYAVSANYRQSSNVGKGLVSAKVPIYRAEEAIYSIFDVFKKMKDQVLDSKRVSDFKKKVRYSTAKNFESNSGHIEAIESKLDFGISPEENFENWNKVTPKTIHEAANKYLPEESGNYVLCLVNPLKEE